MDKNDKKLEKNIKPIHEVFNENKEIINDEEVIHKNSIFKILFQNYLIDILDFDIFFYDALLDKIEPNSDYLSFEQYFHIFLFVYSQQVNNTTSEEININEIPGDDITSMSKESMDQMMDNEVFQNTVNIVKNLYNLRHKNEKNFYSCYPDFGQELFLNLLKKDNIRSVFNFSDSLKDIFLTHSKMMDLEKLSLLNLFELIQIIRKYNAICHLDSLKLSAVIMIFILPNTQLELSTISTLFEDIDCSKDREVLKKMLEQSYSNLDEINFTFSNFVLIVAMMSFFYKFPEEEKINDDVKRIDIFFSSNLEIERNRVDKSISIQSEKKEVVEEEEEFVPSKRLEDALRQQMEKQFSVEDTNFLVETLSTLDKELTDTTYIDIIGKTQNPLNNSNVNNFPISHVSNYLSYTGKIEQPYLFPQKLLKIELQEQSEKAQKAKEEALIAGAKKKDGNKKDKGPPKRPAKFEDPLDPKKERLKYLGNRVIEDMKHRFFKLSYKDTIVNTQVYPSLLREIMIIPKSLTKEIAEYVLLSYKFQTEGKHDMAISVFEKVKELQAATNIKNDLQVEVFINVNLGNIYESLGLYIQSLRYYMDSRGYADKMDSTNPDSAISYSNLGSCFYHIREAEWSFRCFWKAKEIREYTLGGDTLDTAAIYNNLGCCLYCLQNYYTAYAFFKLAFEIYHQILGPLHSRTLLIKGNLNKLNQLNFSKPFEYKSMSQVPAYWVTADNNKKKKK